jgi:hypothetical protein
MGKGGNSFPHVEMAAASVTSFVLVAEALAWIIFYH